MDCRCRSLCGCLQLCAVVLCLSLYPTLTTTAIAPPVIKIGALVAENTIIGRIAKSAIELAVSEINNDSSLLNQSKIALHMLDSNCSAFLGAAAATELLQQEVVAVIGPQSTAVSHFVAHMGGSMQIPLLSFAATDPALSEFQYPYFFRIAHTDSVQMQAIAAFIGNYGWREVVALYMDDDFGTNGAAALSDALGPVGARLVQKEAFPPDINRTGIGSILTELAAMQTRIFVVHMPQYLGFMLFSEAKYLGMMSAGYVWIVTDSMAGTLGSTELDTNTLNTLEGIIGTRAYYSESPEFLSFFPKWNNWSNNPNGLHIYGLYAYDATWMIAHALNSFLHDGLSFTFKDFVISKTVSGGTSELGRLQILSQGPLLRTKILQTRFSGTSGLIEVNAKGDLIRSEFEIVNMVGGKLNVIGHWNNATQLSVSSPGHSENASLDILVSTGFQNGTFNIIWPGNIAAAPRGWVLPKNGRPLNIAVPNKSGFKQFVSWSGNNSNVTSFHGFCIDVFEQALTYLPYSVPYNFVVFGNSTPVYDDMINGLAEKVFDAVVGDVAITTKRMEKVDFTQPYTESGLVVVVPQKNGHQNYAWAFLRPFTPTMWLTTLAFFLFTGVVIWMLEHKINRDFRGHPKKQVITVLWFAFSTLFFSHREETRSTLGRFVVIIWLFVVLIITSSYTANLTSILTVQQLTPTIQGISSLQASNVPVGYQTGSFVRDYLIGLNIAKERLKPLSTMAAYANALNLGPSGGGVAAIVDELPYVQVFLSTHCGYTIAGQVFTKAGWGFAFPKDSELAIDMSTAILSMSERGQLQRIYDAWLSSDQCKSGSPEADSNQLSLSSFWGLFLVTGLASITSLFIYLIRLLRQFSRRSEMITSDSSRSMSRSARLIRSFASYVDEPKDASKNENGSTGKEKRKKEKVAQRPDQNLPEHCQSPGEGSLQNGIGNLTSIQF